MQNTADGADRFDIFMSLSGADRRRAGTIVAELRDRGLKVFLDQDEIGLFRGITPRIEAALRNSRAFVVYYSKSYPERPSCQFELTMAFLAGQAEGDPTGRILVINPEATTDHLQPAELSDIRYLPEEWGTAEIARLIARRVAELDGVIDSPGLQQSPHHGRMPGVHGFVGRHREQWALHSALHAPDLLFSQEGMHGPVAWVVGMPGIGKTSLVAAYAWRYGAAFPGGVHWIGLGRDSPSIRHRYGRNLVAMARRLGVTFDGTSRYPVRAADRARAGLARHLAEPLKPALWIVDGVPGDADPSLIHDLVLPGCGNVRTILISDRATRRSDAPAIRLNGLSASDAVLLLGSHRWPEDPVEEEALHRLAGLLDGHAGALREIAQRLADEHGTLTYERACKEVEAGQEPLWMLKRIEHDIAALGANEKRILQLAMCGGGTVRAERVVESFRDSDVVGPGDDAVAVARTALDALHRRFLVSRAHDEWSVNPIVLKAVDGFFDRRRYPVPAPTV